MKTEEKILCYKQKEMQNFINQNNYLREMKLENQLELFKTVGMNNITFFFRNKDTLDFMKENIIPSYKKVRIASVGCSEGREPYSILFSNWEDREKMEIDAYEMSQNRLNRCIKAEYKIIDLPGLEKHDEAGLIMENCPSDFYQITENPEKCRKNVKLSKETKSKIKFLLNDIMDKPLPKKYDIISMQNVLIYYEESGRQRILENVTKSMENDGWLLCENVYWDESDEWLWEYKKSMENLEDFGLVKQDIGEKLQIYKKN